MTEFELIEKFFQQTPKRSDVVLGIGDDCAIVEIPELQQLAVTMDTLVSGVHFFENAAAFDVGYKSLAVNLSDLAAMGARPAWVTLALTLPEANEIWLKEFCRGFFELVKRFNLQLIGGDLTRGPLSITVQAQGFLPVGKALTRGGAKVGDLIFVSGTLGDAAFALKCLREKIPVDESALAHLHRPEPRIELGEEILTLAHAAIDISDGLAADLKHILEKSSVGAVIDVEKLPLSDALHAAVSEDEAFALALNGGDDYELCFTAPASLADTFCEMQLPITCIGKITSQKTLELQQNGKIYHGKTAGYQHF
jgi:thiamine-monophosphate kinase